MRAVLGTQLKVVVELLHNGQVQDLTGAEVRSALEDKATGNRVALMTGTVVNDPETGEPTLAEIDYGVVVGWPVGTLVGDVWARLPDSTDVVSTTFEVEVVESVTPPPEGG